MRSQSPERRYWRWFGVLVVLVMLVAVLAVLAAPHYQQGTAGECAQHFAADKTRLDDDRHHWDWWRLWSSLKAVELANLVAPRLAEVIQQAHRGVERVRRTPHLAYSFLRHAGLPVT